MTRSIVSAEALPKVSYPWLIPLWFIATESANIWPKPSPKPQVQTPGRPRDVRVVTSWNDRACHSLAAIGSRVGLYGPVPVQIDSRGIDSWRSWTTTGCQRRYASCVARVRASLRWMPSRLLSWKTYFPQYGGPVGGARRSRSCP